MVVTLENNLELSVKLEMDIPCNPAILLVVYNLETLVLTYKPGYLYKNVHKNPNVETV